MSQGEASSQGGSFFFWLSVLVLGGMLFAAGVLVGHGMAPTPEESSSSLDKMDKRDTGLVSKKRDENFTFPHTLSESELKIKDAHKTKSDTASKSGVKLDPGEKKLEEQQDRALKTISGKVPVDEQREKKTEKNTNKVQYSIQVASFPQESQARDLVHKLKTQGLEKARHVSGEVAGKGTYYRVRVGQFQSRQNALDYMNKKKIKGLVILSDQ